MADSAIVAGASGVAAVLAQPARASSDAVATTTLRIGLRIDLRNGFIDPPVTTSPA